jgi:hypothetical protein
MDGETKTRAGLCVSIRESNALGLKGTTTGDSELVASNVVLSTASRASSVESDSLRPQQVVTRRNVGRDLEVKLSAYEPSACCQSIEHRRNVQL